MLKPPAFQMFYKTLKYWNFIFYNKGILCEPRKWTLSHCGRPRSLSTFEFTKWLLVTMHFNSLAFEYAEKGKLLSMCQCVCQCVYARMCTHVSTLSRSHVSVEVAWSLTSCSVFLWTGDLRTSMTWPLKGSGLSWCQKGRFEPKKV